MPYWIAAEQSKSADRLKRAVEYLRMSTEHQKYSTANQAEVIRLHAARGGYQIIRTYSDARQKRTDD